MPNKDLIAFYLGMESYPGGATIKDMLQHWTDEQLEVVHDYIQWLFPTVQKSQFNAKAPTLDEETIAAWKDSTVLQSTQLDALNRMCAFYGLQLVPNVSPPQIIKTANYWERKANWQEAGSGYINHNLLRLTRIIDSLATLGLPQYGLALYRCLESIAKEEPECIPAKTVQLWRLAAVGKFQLPTKRRLERQLLEECNVCPEQIDRMLWCAKNATMLFEKRENAFKALDMVDRMGGSEVTARNLKPLRSVLAFIAQECQYNCYEMKDILQPVQLKLEPGYDMATAMFGALYTEACKYQLAQEEGYIFALTCALMALRVEIHLDVKQRVLGSDNKKGIKNSLLLIAEVYERINEPERASELAAVACDLG